MIMTYIASSGNTYDLTVRIPTREANYHSWQYKPRSTTLQYGERLSYFQRPALQYKTTLLVKGSPTERKAILTALHDDFERDIRKKQTGMLMYGEWYCECYMIESNTEPDKDVDFWTNNEVIIYVPSGFWIKNESKSFGSSVIATYPYLDYTFDYSYDFSASAYGAETWVTDAPFDSDFKLEIYGAVVNPRIVINGWSYIVYASIAEGETLVIDSRAKTVMCGNRNLFDNRNKKQSVFKQIPSGTLSITWGSFAFKITLYEERSEPKW